MGVTEWQKRRGVKQSPAPVKKKKAKTEKSEDK